MLNEKDPVEIQPNGSYLTGLVGALIGALIGAVLWCLIMQLGIISAIVGFAIGWLAERGYTLCKGKVGKGKVVILAVAVIVGVLVGIFAAHYVDWYRAISEYYPDAVATINGREVSVDYSDIPNLIVYYLSTDSEYMGDTIRDTLLGLLFSFLGVFSLLKNAGKQAAAKKQEEAAQDMIPEN